MKPTTDKKIIYSTPRFEVCCQQFDGKDEKSKDFYFIDKPDAVSVIVLKAEKIGLILTERPITKTISWEVPGGRMDRGETPLETAKRELLEETGLTATSLELLTTFYPLPSVTTEKMHIYICKVHPNQKFTFDKQEGIVDFRFFSSAEIKKLIHIRQINCSIDGFALLYFLSL